MRTLFMQMLLENIQLILKHAASECNIHFTSKSAKMLPASPALVLVFVQTTDLTGCCISSPLGGSMLWLDCCWTFLYDVENHEKNCQHLVRAI